MIDLHIAVEFDVVLSTIRADVRNKRDNITSRRTLPEGATLTVEVTLHTVSPALAGFRQDVAAVGRRRPLPQLCGIGLTEKDNEYTQLLRDGRARNLLEGVMSQDGEPAVACAPRPFSTPGA